GLQVRSQQGASLFNFGKRWGGGRHVESIPRRARNRHAAATPCLSGSRENRHWYTAPPLPIEVMGLLRGAAKKWLWQVIEITGRTRRLCRRCRRNRPWSTCKIEEVHHVGSVPVAVREVVGDSEASLDEF